MKKIIIITQDMVGNRIIKAFGKSWFVGHALGSIMEIDVGKKLVLGKVIQLESNNQYKERMTPNSVKFIRK